MAFSSNVFCSCKSENACKHQHLLNQEMRKTGQGKGYLEMMSLHLVAFMIIFAGENDCLITSD